MCARIPIESGMIYTETDACHAAISFGVPGIEPAPNESGFSPGSF